MFTSSPSPIYDRIRERYVNSTIEIRTRAELCIARIKDLRAKHACLMSLSPEVAFRLQRRAVRQDTCENLTHLHTNKLGVTWFKYNKKTT